MKITDTEKTIIGYTAEGFTKDEIANIMGRKKGTVQCHQARLQMKTNTKNMAHLVSWAYKNKILGV